MADARTALRWTFAERMPTLYGVQHVNCWRLVDMYVGSMTGASATKPGLRHALGVFTGFLAALSVTIDGLFVKLASRDGASISTIMLCKAGFGVAFLLVMLPGLRVLESWRDPAMPLCEWKPITPSGVRHILFGSLMAGLMSSGFSLAFYFATSANVLALTALAPIWTAMLTRPVLGMRLPWRTIVANVGALIGAATVVVGVALEARGEAPRSARDSVVGTLCAIVVSIAAALYLITIRSCGQRAPETNMMWASPIGMTFSVLIAAALMPALQPPGQTLAPSPDAYVWLVLSGFFVVALALLLITTAVRLASPAEVSLMLQLEGFLGPISVYVFLNEVPSPYSLGGGGLVLAMVIGHEALALIEYWSSHSADPAGAATPAEEAFGAELKPGQGAARATAGPGSLAEVKVRA
jgi:drug/metabolite transporter (DMT)-like permease